MKYLLSLIISGALVVSGFGQTRNVLVNTNNAVVQPTNFWSADASNARSGLGLGTAATNPASAFQPSSLVLSNLASSNAVNLTNLRATNVVGTLSLAQGGTGATNAAQARENLGLGTNSPATFERISLTSGGGTNTLALQFETNNTGFYVSGSLSTGPWVFVQNGSVAFAVLTNQNAFYRPISFLSNSAPATRTNLGLGWSALTNTDATNFRDAIGLGATNDVVFQNITASNASFRVYEGTNLVIELASDQDSYFGYPIDFLNTNARIQTRNNLGLKHIVTTDQGVSGWITEIYDDTNATNPIISVGGQAGVSLYGAIAFGGANASTNRAISRNSLGLGWSAITNTNTAGFNTSLYGSGTNPVLYNTNGEVVSPTNFWQSAPIVTRFVEFDPPTNATTNIVAARNLHIHSLAISRTGVTSTITLPTNGSTFVGDVALVVHQGPTSSMTRVRTAGSTNDLVTMTRFDEAVEFVYYDNVWQFNHNLSFIEPIYFSGTNAAANAAASRTNLGLGTANDVIFNTLTASFVQSLTTNAYVEFDDNNLIMVSDLAEFRSPIIFDNTTNAATTRTNLGLGTTNNVSFSNVTASGTLTATGVVTTVTNLNVGGAINMTNKAESRTNLGLGGGITTNLVLKNSANQDTYMNFSNGILIYGSTVAP